MTSKILTQAELAHLDDNLTAYIRRFQDAYMACPATYGCALRDYLPKELGFSYQSVRNILIGKSKFTYPMLMKLCLARDLPVVNCLTVLERLEKAGCRMEGEKTVYSHTRGRTCMVTTGRTPGLRPKSYLGLAGYLYKHVDGNDDVGAFLTALRHTFKLGNKHN